MSLESEELCFQALPAPSTPKTHTHHTPPPPPQPRLSAVMTALPAPRRRPRPHPGSSVFREQPRDSPAPRNTPTVGGQVPREFPRREQWLSQELPGCHLGPHPPRAGAAGAGLTLRLCVGTTVTPSAQDRLLPPHAGWSACWAQRLASESDSAFPVRLPSNHLCLSIPSSKPEPSLP